MKGNKVFLGALVVATSTLLPVIGFAASCQSATNVAGKLYEKVGEEAKMLGCAALEAASAKDQGFNTQEFVSCYQKAGFATGVTKTLTHWWNDQVAKNGVLTVGARRLETDKELTGKLIGTSGRMFISFPLEKESITVTLAEKGGKDKVSAVVCTHEPDGKWEQVETLMFNDTDSGKSNQREVKRVILKNVKGHEVSVHLDGKGVLGSFEYAVSAN